jgi:hypothetical protein
MKKTDPKILKVWRRDEPIALAGEMREVTSIWKTMEMGGLDERDRELYFKGWK